MTRTTSPTDRAIRTLMAWNGDDAVSLGRKLGVTRETITRRFSRGLTREQLIELAELYGVDPLDLALGRLDLRSPTRGYGVPDLAGAL